MSTVISIENVSKAYQLGMIGGATLKDDFSRWWARLRGQVDPLSKVGSRENKRKVGDLFWALRDVNFEVAQGETLGIIGRNGAGKSTLLKILSQVTAPTSGEIGVKGRIASLLEVGTGFHPELTGQENIFLNGAILGMSKGEIRAKFDEIVAFSGVGEFINTPVKRYSSGMHVRLAFAVAAHLEPEILIVDEVLAVGDAEFQKKCLGKMRNVASEGRTVIFVSHNMSAISALCRTAITLENGRLLDHGTVDIQISRYLGRLREVGRLHLSERTDREGDGSARVIGVAFVDPRGEQVEHLFSGQDVSVKLTYRTTNIGVSPVLALSCFSSAGEKVFHIDNTMTNTTLKPADREGTYTCVLSKLPLPPGHYHLNFMMKFGEVVADHVYAAALVEVLPADFFQSGTIPSAQGGLVFAEHRWVDRAAQPSKEREVKECLLTE